MVAVMTTMSFPARWLLKLIGPALLVFFLMRIEPAWFMQKITGVGLLPFSLAFLLTIPILWLRVCRWRMLLGTRPLPYMETFRVYALFVLMGSFTPGQVGELGKALYLRSKNYEPGLAWFSTFLDRILDVVFLVGCGFLLFWGYEGLPGGVLAGVLLLALGSLLLFKLGSKVWPVWRRKWLQRKAQQLKTFLDGANFSLPSYTPATLLGAMLPTSFAWLLNWAAIWVLARAMGLEIPFFFLCWAMTAAALLALLPITVMGMGTRDAVLIFMLARIDIDGTSALALSAMVLLLRLIYIAICGFSHLLLIGDRHKKTEPIDLSRIPGDS